MKIPQNYIELNKASWNGRTPEHIKSEFYDVAGFLAGNNSLNEIELELLGDLTGKTVLHLQCHFGQDTISLSRLGATVIGVDFSEAAIDYARQLAKESGSTAEFICCNILELPNFLNQEFDIVFSSYGTIIWLPNLNEWAGIVSKYLKPSGKFVFADFHPVALMFDDNFEKFTYNYFNTGAIFETENGTYANKEANIKSEFVTWNHSFAEIFGSLWQHGLTIESFAEFDYSPYNCFNNLIEDEPQKYRVKHLEIKIPLVYSLAATKMVN